MHRYVYAVLAVALVIGGLVTLAKAEVRCNPVVHTCNNSSKEIGARFIPENSSTAPDKHSAERQAASDRAHRSDGQKN